ncbi:MAG: hypothetical protein ABI282_11480 [Candidatus Baltobacteraceae bacterium]
MAFLLVASFLAACSGGQAPMPGSQSINSQAATRLSASGSLSTFSGLALKSEVDPDVLLFAKRLIATNPALKGDRVVQLAYSWRAGDVRASSALPASGNPFTCSPSGPYSLLWNGDAPPNCDQGSAGGPFRGVFSISHRAAAEAWIGLPDSKNTMPTNNPPAGQGFVYIEAWPTNGAVNAEGGFQYNAGSNTYTPYAAAPGGREGVVPGYTIPPDEEVHLWEGAVDKYNSDVITYPSPAPGQTAEPCSAAGGCAGTYFAYPIPGVIFTDVVRIADSGMDASSASCCFFRRMTTIAQRNDAMEVQNPGPMVPATWQFGPVVWYKSDTEHYDPSVSPSPGATPNDDVPDGNPSTNGWKLGSASDLGRDLPGYSNYPNCGGYMSLSVTNAEIETDTILMPSSYPVLPCTPP